MVVDSKHRMLYAATSESDFRYSMEISSAHVIGIRTSDFKNIEKLAIAVR